MKKILPLLLGAALLVCLAGCGGPPDGGQSTRELSQSDASDGACAVENPFAQAQPQESSLSHGMRVTDPGKRPEIAYTGGECRVDYFVSATGMGRNFGFLLYLDGVPQPYKLKQEGEYAYLHSVSLAQDAEDMPFTFFFTPVTGGAGASSTLTVMSVTNPQFQPDMAGTTSYGAYHSPLTAEYPISFEDDPPPFTATAQVKACLLNMSRQALPLTSGWLDERGWDAAQLNQGVFQFITYNGEMRYDNLAVSGDAPAAVHYELAGIPGMRTTTTFYLNHTPIADGNGVSTFENTFASGEAIVYDFEIDPAKLDGFSTFYAVTVPLDPGDYPDYPISALKTESILFYQQEAKNQ